MTNKDKFSAAYKRLNTEQKKAVDTIEGLVMVIAGPGTGKTEVLTMRIANIIDKTDTPPEAILALTFTESGVTSMRRRLADLIGTPAYQVTISTFHGFANSVIKNHPDRFPEIIGSSSITDIDQVRILKDIFENEPIEDTLRPFGDKYYYLKPVLSSINELKRQGVSPSEFEKIIAEERRGVDAIDDLYYESGAHKGKMKGKYKDEIKHIERNEEFVTIYKKYEAKLRAEKSYDYSDMIMYVMLALEKDEDLRLILQESYLYFLVDEHQDTNDAQNKIVELLASFHKSPNLFVVGDEKQAIFRFQGASIANFFHFKNIYKDVTLIPLQSNYRSTQTILDAAQVVSPRETTLIAKAGHTETPISLAEFSSPEVEYYFLAKKIKGLIETGVQPEEVVVLYRENKDAAPLAHMLEKQGVPFNIESDQDVLGDEGIKKLLRILTTIQRYGSAPELFDLLHIDFLEIPPLDIYKLASYCAVNKRLNPYNVIKSESLLEEAGVETKDKLVELSLGISDWKRKSENLGTVEAFESIVRESGFLVAILNRPASIEKIAKLHSLFEHLRSLIENKKDYTLKDFFEYLDLIREQGVSIKSSDTVRLPGRIRLMTAHKSKGQEFEYVFIINTLDGKWGSNTRRQHIRLPDAIYRTLKEVENKLDQDDDERNLFYVAITRAKKEVYITYSKTRRDGKEQLPTKFVQEIKENLLSPCDVSGYEQEFAAHREIEFAPRLNQTPEIKDKEFLNSLFETQGLSATALGNYLSCPWKYFYVNLIRIPEAFNKHLMYGNAMHETLRNYFDQINKGEDKGKDYLVARFEQELNRQPIQKNDYEEALAKGKKALQSYYDNYYKSWIKRTLNEQKVAGIELAGGVLINGKLDKIEFLGEGNEVNVVDYKTGKPRSRNIIEGNTKSSDGNYKRQLVFYNLLLDKANKFKMISGEIDFVESDEKGKFHKEKFLIDPIEVLELEKEIIHVAEEIKNLAFWDMYCDDADCRYCELRKELV